MAEEKTAWRGQECTLDCPGNDGGNDREIVEKANNFEVLFRERKQWKVWQQFW